MYNRVSKGLGECKINYTVKPHYITTNGKRKFWRYNEKLWIASIIWVVPFNPRAPVVNRIYC